jgi:hypothetical protein
MYTLSAFLKMGLLDAVGKKPVYWIVDNAEGWFSKGELEESDLAEIYSAIKAQEEAQTDA